VLICRQGVNGVDQGVGMMTTTRTSAQPMREQVRETRALELKPVLFAVLAAVVGTALTGLFGTGRLGAYAGVAIPPLVTAVFTTHGRGAARPLGIALLTVLAVVVAVTGYTIPEFLRGGQSLVANRDGTFIKAPAKSSSGGGSGTGSGSGSSTGNTSALSVPAQLQCPDTAVNSTSTCRFAVQPVGSATLKVT
jgi:hypothetical protein